MPAGKRRTKMAKTSLSVFRDELARVKTPKQLALHAKRYKSGRAREILEIIRTTKSKNVAGFTVYFVDFKDPVLVKDNGFIAGKIIFLDRKTYGRIPRKFLRFILRHEFREELLLIAGYSPKRRGVGNTLHRIALQKELRDAQRAGLLPEYLLALKKAVPKAYAERMAKWDIDPKTLQPRK